ncbi:MAG: hypothetical protein ACFFA0_10385 [Promethearchaeota archaeon]
MVGFLGGIIFGEPPFEATNYSYNFHVWLDFIILVIVVWKTYISYFKKTSIYKNAKWLGIVTFIGWAYLWVASAFSYYLRTIPPNDQHEPPTYLLPIELMWLQILIPFFIGIVLSIFISRSAEKFERRKLNN